MGLLLISHDLPLVAAHCQRVMVMYQVSRWMNCPPHNCRRHILTPHIMDTAAGCTDLLGTDLPALDRTALQALLTQETHHAGKNNWRRLLKLIIFQSASDSSGRWFVRPVFISMPRDFSLIGESGCGNPPFCDRRIQREWLGGVQLLSQHIHPRPALSGLCAAMCRWSFRILMRLCIRSILFTGAFRTITHSPRK